MIPRSAALRDIVLLLTFKSKVKGRCVRQEYPPFDLRANDRLEPSRQMAGVMQFERLIEFLYIVLFWRCLEHPVVLRGHPLLSAEMGASIDEFSVDVLHALHLGIFQDWILRALWLSVDFDLLDAGRKAKSQILTETLSRIRRMLSAWYPIYEKKLGGNKDTRVGSVFNNLIGSDGEALLGLRHGSVSPSQRSAARARGRIGLAEHVAAVAHGGAEVRATATVVVASPTTPMHRLLQSE